MRFYQRRVQDQRGPRKPERGPESGLLAGGLSRQVANAATRETIHITTKAQFERARSVTKESSFTKPLTDAGR